MKYSKKVLILALSLTQFSGFSQINSSLPVTGNNSDNEGVFAHSHYPNTFGHDIPAPYDAFGNDTAYYFLSSADYQNFNPSAEAGMHGNGTVAGFTNLMAALNYYGKTIGDIKIQFDGANLGNDVKTEDWDLVGDTETRIYQQGTFAVLLNSDTILKGSMPALRMTIDYNSELTPFDDQISAFSDFVVPTKHYNNNSIADSIGRAFYEDAKMYGLSFVFSSIQPAGQTEERTNELVGAFFEIPSGAIETGAVQIADLGDTIYACYGEDVTLDGGAGMDNYTWSHGPTTQTSMITATGNYSVMVEKDGKYYNTKPVHVLFDLCTGNEELNSNSILVYPNPMQQTLTIQSDNNIEQIFIKNSIGAVVMTISNVNAKKVLVETNQLSSGVYFIETFSNQKSTITSVVK